MAALSKAPTEQLAKAVERRTKLKALLAKHKIGYERAYSSYDTRKGQVRMKLWAINKPVPAPVMAKMLKLGFTTQQGTPWCPVVSIVGYF